MSISIERHFVTLEGKWGARQVHYRRAGSGPLLLMLHQSPQSSRELMSLMEQWAPQFTVVAPDSPGYGLSDPLGVDVAQLSDFATATVEFIDAIGGQQFGIYGFHTGGMIGIAIADGYPDRVTALACNGVAIPTAAELEEILAVYLPPFEPRWDGGHLAWLWGRTREQTIFFPWHNRTLAGRMDFPMPSPEHQQNSVLEFFRSGDHYRVAYRAAFEFHAEDVIPRLHVPALITAADWDPLQPHLRRIKGYPNDLGSVKIVESATPFDALSACLALLQEHPGGGVPDRPATQPITGKLWRQIVRTEHGELLVRVAGDEQSNTCVLIHDAGGSGATMAELAGYLAKEHRVIAIDLPGHGESNYAVSANGPDSGACAAAVHACLEALGVTNLSVIGQGAGATVALELANRQPQTVSRCVVLDLPALSADEVAAWREYGLISMAPEWSGGHLLRCWDKVRDGRLYFPWFKRDRAGIIWQEPQLDDRAIQLEVSELLKAEGSWQSLLAAQLDYPVEDRLANRPMPVVCAASARSVWLPAARTLAKKLNLPFTELPAQVAAQAEALSQLLVDGGD